jgi:hypothetical protein
MEMPKVSECRANECAYNKDGMCHALAITIGDGFRPQCDTFCLSPVEGGDPACTGCVGACKVADCVHNTSLECQAPDVCVGYNEGGVDCLTFSFD